jgi:anti-anti-sigma factor
LISITEPHLTGEIMAEIFKIEVGRLINKYHPPLVVIDLSNVRMISSVVVGAFVKLHQSLRATGGQLRQCCVPSVVESVYRTANLFDTVFEVYETPEQALGPA